MHTLFSIRDIIEKVQLSMRSHCCTQGRNVILTTKSAQCKNLAHQIKGRMDRGGSTKKSTLLYKIGNSYCAWEKWL